MVRSLLRLLITLCLFVNQAQAIVTVRDDAGDAVTLSKPAQRVVSLAPHITELLFAAGAGDRIVGVAEYSDYPPPAKYIPRVSDNREIDMERLIAMKPDLVVAWLHGGPDKQVEQLRKIGIPVFYSEPRKLNDIPDNIVRLGRLLGTEAQARRQADALRGELGQLRAKYAHRSTVRVFYQIWDKPLYTLNGQHIVNDALHVCGGENIFANMTAIAPVVGIEAVLQRDPEVILSTSENDAPGRGADIWKAYPNMTAVKRGNLMRVDGILLNRPGPRMIAGAAALCGKLEQVRAHRGRKQAPQ